MHDQRNAVASPQLHRIEEGQKPTDTMYKIDAIESDMTLEMPEDRARDVMLRLPAFCAGRFSHLNAVHFDAVDRLAHRRVASQAEQRHVMSTRREPGRHQMRAFAVAARVAWIRRLAEKQQIHLTPKVDARSPRGARVQ